MPALPSVPKVIRIALKYAVGEFLNAIVTDHLQYTGTAPDNTQLDALALTIANAWLTDLAELHTSDRKLEAVNLTDLSTPSSAVGLWTGSYVGTRTDVPLPASTSLIWQRKISRRYRGGHSRQYWPMGGDTALSDAQTWGSAFVTAALTNLQAYAGLILAGGWGGAGTLNFVNVSYYEGFTNVLYPSGRYHVKPTLRGTPVVDLLASVGINPRIGSQRRRDMQSS